MAAFDFPSSPSVGQIYSPGGGAPSYVFDGVGWAAITPGPRNPQSAGYRNLFINGGFDFDQRNQTISGLVGGGWAADRWLVQSAGSTITRTLPLFALGQTLVPGEPRQALSLAIGSVAGAANYAYMVQKLEGVRLLSGGETYTLSFYATSSVAKTIGFELQRSFGTGGSPSAGDSMNCQRRFDLTTAWQKFTHTFVAPSLVGKVTGNNVDDCPWCIFWLDTGSNFAANSGNIGQLSATILFANMQLEHGPVATDFERLPPQRILMMCQRYYENLFQQQQFPNLPGGNTGAFTFAQRFRVTKRTGATVVMTPSLQSNISSSTSYGAFVDAHHNQIIATTTFTNISQTLNLTASAELP